MLLVDDCITTVELILLVEDNGVTALSQQLMLERHGYRVDVAATGDEALEMVRNNPCITLVLMDIDLGRGMDGSEAARRILEYRDIPVIFLTGHVEQEMVERVRGITRYGYVLKNTGEFVLLESIQVALELHRTRKRQEQLLEQNTLLLREVHHRVKNNMSTIKGLLSLQISASDNPAVKTALGEAVNRVGVMASAYEDLSAGNDYSRIPLKPLVRNIISGISGCRILSGGAIIHHTIEPIILPANMAVHTGIIINELLMNSRKHAFPGGGEGRIQVTVRYAEEGELEIRVTDNGAGIPPDKLAGRPRGTGLNIVRGLVRQYDGRMDIKNNGGTDITIRMVVG